MDLKHPKEYDSEKLESEGGETGNEILRGGILELENSDRKLNNLELKDQIR